jgi:hypothetical protein
MTEAEWLACEAPDRMLASAGPGLSARKCRLLACAQCRYGTHRTPAWLLYKLGAAERFADGAASRAELLSGRAMAPPRDPDEWAIWAATWDPGPGGGRAADVLILDPRPGWVAGLVRDVFGNPFRPVAFHARWRTADTVGLARGVYEDRAFDRLPLLADALMDAGCADEDILAHCRSDGPHVRGCWVVDLVLGKE